MDKHDADLALVRRAQSGDKQAFNLLVQKYQYRVKHLVCRFVSNQADQDDVVQESFLKAYRSLANFRGDSAFYTWLYRVTVNTSKNFLVSRSRKLSSFESIDGDSMFGQENSTHLVENASPEVVTKNDRLVEAIKQAIEELPQELKEAIQLREIDGMSYEDIAQLMKCPIGTVRSRIFRARESIRRSISDHV